MTHSPLKLAALAAAAVPGLDVYDVLRSPRSDADFEVVVVRDGTGKRWVVQAPLSPAAGAAQAAEVDLLRSLDAAKDKGWLEFSVPQPQGFAHMEAVGAGRIVVYSEVSGAPLHLAAVKPGPGLAAAIGRAIGSIHELPTDLIENLGLPVYSADEFRERRLVELDTATQTGLVPAKLADRWEQRLENVAWWRFNPTVIHGDLGEHRILVKEGQVAGVTHWMSASVSDPAEDLAWLTVAADGNLFDSIWEAYHLRRREIVDPHLRNRAELSAEMALMRWLMHGVRTEDENVITDAESMLADLLAELQL